MTISFILKAAIIMHASIGTCRQLIDQIVLDCWNSLPAYFEGSVTGIRNTVGETGASCNTGML